MCPSGLSWAARDNQLELIWIEVSSGCTTSGQNILQGLGESDQDAGLEQAVINRGGVTLLLEKTGVVRQRLKLEPRDPRKPEKDASVQFV